MYMRAYFLASLSGAKGSNYRHQRRGFTRLLRRTVSAPQRGIEVCLCRLVIVDAVQAETEVLHDDIGAEVILPGLYRVYKKRTKAARMVPAPFWRVQE
jgi:hypothetical protein